MNGELFMSKGPRWNQRTVEDMLLVLNGRLEALETMADEELTRLCSESLQLVGIAKTASREVKVKELKKKLWRCIAAEFINEKNEESESVLMNTGNHVVRLLESRGGVCTEPELRKILFRELRISGEDYRNFLEYLARNKLVEMCDYHGEKLAALPEKAKEIRERKNEIIPPTN